MNSCGPANEGKKIAVKAMLFDLDGTLLDSREAYEEALANAMESVGRKTFERELVTEIPRRLEQNLPIEDLISGIETSDFLAVYLDCFYRAAILKSKPLPDVRETLEKLAKKAKLAIITARRVSNTEVKSVLKQHGLERYIDQIVTALVTQRPKPFPETILKCASLFGVRPSECAIIGDSISDVKAGKAAGAKTVAVSSGIYSSDELKKQNPDLLLEKVSQLVYFVI